MGMEKSILAFKMNDASLRKKIAEIARDSSRVIVTSHAKKQMRKRRILITLVIKCLCRGNVIESAHQDIHGCWKLTLELAVCGDVVKVAAALDRDEAGEFIIVITVMH